MSQITIVDKDDNVLGPKDRDSITRDDIYRVVCLWITNSNNQVLLAKRASTKKHDPNKWGPAVAGTVEWGEEYDDVMKREAYEELGLEDVEMTKTKKVFSKGSWDHFTQCYIANLDYAVDRFKVQEEEVSEIKWFDAEELRRLVVDQPDMFLPNMPSVLKNFMG